MLQFSPTRIYVIAFLLLAGCASEVHEEPLDTWIDVRSESEYQQSSISGHANIPHTEIAARITELVNDKDTPIYLYCRSGRRAGLAKTALEEMGYTQVSNAGGIEDVRQRLGPD